MVFLLLQTQAVIQAQPRQLRRVLAPPTLPANSHPAPPHPPDTEHPHRHIRPRPQSPVQRDPLSSQRTNPWATGSANGLRQVRQRSSKAPGWRTRSQQVCVVPWYIGLNPWLMIRGLWVQTQTENCALLSFSKTIHPHCCSPPRSSKWVPGKNLFLVMLEN